MSGGRRERGIEEEVGGQDHYFLHAPLNVHVPLLFVIVINNCKSKFMVLFSVCLVFVLNIDIF